MARTARNSRLDNRTARLKLEPGHRYYVKIGAGIALGYRRTTAGYGNWQVRVMMGDGRYDFHLLGRADDYLPADGADVLDYYQAQASGREAAKSMRLPKGKTTEPLTIAMAAAQYLTWFKDNRKAYRETEQVVSAHILPTLGERLIHELEAPEIRAWLNRLASSPPKRRTRSGEKQRYGDKPTTHAERRARKATANRILTVLKAILNKAFHDELISDDKAWRKVKPFAHADEPVTRFLTADESTRLVNACTPDFRALVKAALYTGARCSELTALRVSDFNSTTRNIYFRPGKSGRGRHVPLNADGLDFFEIASAGLAANAFIFTRPDGKPWGKNHHVRPLAAACERAKIDPPISFHELRHTYASFLAQSGVDLLTISKLLGHADTRITSRHYAHLADKTLADAVNAHLPSFGHEPSDKVAKLHAH